MSSYCFSTLFTETNSSLLIFEFIRALEIKTSTLFNLVFVNSANSFANSFFFLISYTFTYYLYFLVPAFIMEIFVFVAELAIPTGISTKESKAEIEKHPEL